MVLRCTEYMYWLPRSVSTHPFFQKCGQCLQIPITIARVDSHTCTTDQNCFHVMFVKFSMNQCSQILRIPSKVQIQVYYTQFSEVGIDKEDYKRDILYS